MWTSLRDHDAGEQAALIRSRQLSPVDAVEATLAAIEATNAHINAFVTVCADEARTAAREAEAAVMAREPLGPLHGVPVLVKDLVRTAGVRTTYGSLTHAQHVPTHDALPVARLRAAGAIVVGKTTTPEFGHKTLTDAPLTGITRNPWDTERTCGGSSGGNAAAVATGVARLSLGTDAGGSIRIPAACCGIVGLKPTIGRIAYPEADDSFLNMSHYGPMTRSVADAWRMLAVLAGPDPADAASLRLGGAFEPQPPAPTERLDGLRVGWMPRVGAHPLDDAVEAAVRAAARAFEASGAVIEPVTLDLVSEEDVFVRLLRSGLWARSRQLLEQRRAEIGNEFARSIALGAEVSAEQVHTALLRRTALFRALQQLLERVDVLLSPTLTAPAVRVTQGHFEPVTIAGVAHPSLRTGWHPYAFVANLTGHPALSVPCGMHEGLPIGAQLIGRWGEEARLLALGAHLEAQAMWSPAWPSVGDGTTRTAG